MAYVYRCPVCNWVSVKNATPANECPECKHRKMGRGYTQDLVRTTGTDIEIDEVIKNPHLFPCNTNY